MHQCIDTLMHLESFLGGVGIVWIGDGFGLIFGENGVEWLFSTLILNDRLLKNRKRRIQ